MSPNAGKAALLSSTRGLNSTNPLPAYVELEPCGSCFGEGGAPRNQALTPEIMQSGHDLHWNSHLRYTYKLITKSYWITIRSRDNQGLIWFTVSLREGTQHPKPSPKGWAGAAERCKIWKYLSAKGLWQDLPHLMYNPGRPPKLTSSRWDRMMGLRAREAAQSKGGNTVVAGAVFKDNNNKKGLPCIFHPIEYYRKQ